MFLGILHFCTSQKIGLVPISTTLEQLSAGPGASNNNKTYHIYIIITIITIILITTIIIVIIIYITSHWSSPSGCPAIRSSSPPAWSRDSCEGRRQASVCSQPRLARPSRLRREAKLWRGSSPGRDWCNDWGESLERKSAVAFGFGRLWNCTRSRVS